MNEINYEKRVEVYQEALKQYGQWMQMIVALEELSEIQKEICKELRGGRRSESSSGRNCGCYNYAGTDQNDSWYQ